MSQAADHAPSTRRRHGLVTGVLDRGRAAAHLRLPFQQADLYTASGKNRRDGQPADATANDDDFIFHLVKLG